MPTATPTPYRNITRDIENEELNAAHLQEGVEDAKARLKAASLQYHATPGAPQEEIYNRAIKDVQDRMNAVDRAKSRAAELRIKAKPKAKTMDSLDEQGRPVIDFQEPMEITPKKQPSRDPSSLQTLINFMSPQSAEAAPSNIQPLGPSTEAMQQAAAKAASVQNTLLKNKVTSLGQKTNVKGVGHDTSTETQNTFLNQPVVDEVRNAIASTPEWQRQGSGLNDLEHLIGLEAERTAKKTSYDLSPLGAYLDYQNTLEGHPTNLAASLKGSPIEDTSIKDLGEIQRRRGDMAKELINTIKAGKVGQVVQRADGTIEINSGFQAPRPVNMAPTQNAQKNRFFTWADKIIGESDKQKAGLDSLGQILGHNNPASIGRIPLKRAISDMQGSGRVAVQEIMMENGSKALLDKWGQQLQEWKDGKLSKKQIGYLTDAIVDDVMQWDTARKNKFKHVESRAPVFGVGKQELINAYPLDYREEAYTRTENPALNNRGGVQQGAKQPSSMSVDELWEKRKAGK